MKYLLVLIPLLVKSEARPEAAAEAEAGPDADPVNSLLTTHALSVHPLSNPVLPLSPNGVAAAHAAGRVHPIIDHHLHPLPHPPHHIGHPVHHPLLHPPTLQAKVPVGACKLICSILDLLIFNPDFSTFVSAIRAAGLVDLVSEPGPMTVFAPTNAAFDALPPPTFQV